jgi:ribosomal protein L7/L12
MQTVGKIQLIKDVRTELKCGLLEAKQLVDQISNNFMVHDCNEMTVREWNTLVLRVSDAVENEKVNKRTRMQNDYKAAAQTAEKIAGDYLALYGTPINFDIYDREPF